MPANIFTTKKLFSLPGDSWRFIDIETTGLSIKHGAKITEIAVLSNKLEYYWKNKSGKLCNHTLSFFMRNTIIVGHNVMFDLRFLLNELNYSSPVEIRFVDTLALAECLGWPKRLSSIVKKFSLPLKSHEAVDDAKASRFIFDAYRKKYGFPKIHKMMREGNI